MNKNNSTFLHMIVIALSSGLQLSLICFLVTYNAYCVTAVSTVCLICCRVINEHVLFFLDVYNRHTFDKHSLAVEKSRTVQESNLLVFFGHDNLCEFVP